MENLRVESLAEIKEREPPQRVLFTYYQGDINSVVDEHFSRALKKANIPKDLSVKASTPKDHHTGKPRNRSKGIKQGLSFYALSFSCPDRLFKAISRNRLPGFDLLPRFPSQGCAIVQL